MRIEQSIVINRSVDEVFAFVADLGNWTRWVDSMVESRTVTPGPTAKGTVYQQATQILGKRIEQTLEVVEFEHNKVLASRSIKGPISFRGRVTFEAVDGGTRVTNLAEGEPSGILRMAGSLLDSMAKRQFESSLRELKRVLEEAGQASDS